MGWWKQFTEMPDNERAVLLAKASAGVIIAVLYVLGGASLYLRSHYLQPATNTPTPLTEEQLTPAVSSTPELTPSLYPTITPTYTPVTPSPTLSPASSQERQGTATPFPSPTFAPTSTPQPTEMPTAQPIPTEEPSATPEIVEEPTATPTLEQLGPPPDDQSVDAGKISLM